MSEREVTAKGAGAWLTRLARDTRGNTMAIVAASIIPLAGMVGGGVDISRMYIVKTRLQHACDAGALAGRKQMGGGTWAYNNYEARTQAEKFFDANIQTNPYGANSLTKSFTESAGKVTGTASAVLPMTIMRVFGRTTETLTVTCDAEMRLPNTDVMFVLDTTGSMASKAVSTDPDTKIEALKSAVKCFYETVARLDTTETCVGGAPSGGTGNTVQVRFGFVPYATNVNVGRSLKTEWMADNWSYQTREPTYTTSTSSSAGTGTAGVTNTTNTVQSTGGWSDLGSWSGVSQTNCNGRSISGVTTPGTSAITWETNESAPKGSSTTQGTPTTTTTTTSTSSSTTTTTPSTTTWYTERDGWYYEYQKTFSGTASTNGTCKIQRRRIDFQQRKDYSRSDSPSSTVTDTFNRYNYALLSKNVAGLKNGTLWNSAVTMDVGHTGQNVAVNWDGCIEERKTVKQASFSSIPSGAKDLNIDLVPTSSDPESLWGPALPGAVFLRDYTAAYDWRGRPTYSGSRDYNAANNSSSSYLTADGYDYARPGEGPFLDSYFCPQAAAKLQSWSTASTFESYVDSLTPSGNTYHDIGLLWGARFISPTGIFRSENEFTPQGAEIERHLIFMTDGEACTGVDNYTAYGVAWWDRRQTDSGSAPTDGCLTTGTLTQQVNARTAALCTAVKNKNITLWVIWFGASNSTIEDMLENCATSGRFFTARNSTDLQNTFRSIADQISALRLTR